VNAVTKDGGRALSGSASASYQSFLTSHSGIFQGLKASDFSSTRDYKMFLEGPILDETLTFMVNGRYQDVRGHLTGIRRFRVDDYSNFLSAVPSEWYSEHTGDEGVVPMNTNTNWSVFSKLSFQPSGTLRVSFSHSLSDGEYQYYNHYMKFNPDGRSTYRERAHMLALNLNHTLSSSLFHEVKASYTHSGSGDYLYEDPLDGRYVHDEYGRGTGAMFSTGGQYKSYSKRTIADLTGKYDITWQVNKHHTLKGGVLGVQHSINQYATSIQNRYAGTAQELEFVYDSVSAQRVYLYYEPIVYDPSVYTDRYTVRPREFSVYVQDKMEYEEMVINAGVRFDHFDPNTRYPSQPRNPSNQLSFPDNPEYMSTYEKAKPAWQLSPRFGLAYKLGEAALLRFAYGHFFQMPPLYAVYSNYNFLVPPTNYATTMGNPLLKPQKTIQYEVGLWQQLTRSMSLETAVFYRDIYDLLGTKVITTYNQIRYGLYTNLDYGNVMGLELKYEFVAGPLNAMLNYTLQYTRGNADNPTFTFSRAGSNQDPVNILIPMSWDQRHTLNVSVGYNAGGFGATITAYYNSGTPYTWRPIVESQLYRINLFPNNSPKPSQVSVDFSGYYNLWSFGGVDLRLTVLAYNLLDALNEIAVYSTSGRAYTDVVREIDVQGMRSDFATYYDYIHDPSMYGAPRSVKVGLGIQF
jgi:outer membrane receptor protein involved in Fe transport